MLPIVWLHIWETYRVSLHHLSFGVSDDHDQLGLESNNQHWALFHHLAHGQLQEKNMDTLDYNEPLMLLLVATAVSDKVITTNTDCKVKLLKKAPELTKYHLVTPPKVETLKS